MVFTVRNTRTKVNSLPDSLLNPSSSVDERSWPTEVLHPPSSPPPPPASLPLRVPRRLLLGIPRLVRSRPGASASETRQAKRLSALPCGTLDSIASAGCWTDSIESPPPPPSLRARAPFLLPLPPVRSLTSPIPSSSPPTSSPRRFDDPTPAGLVLLPSRLLLLLTFPPRYTPLPLPLPLSPAAAAAKKRKAIVSRGWKRRADSACRQLAQIAALMSPKYHRKITDSP